MANNISDSSSTNTQRPHVRYTIIMLNDGGIMADSRTLCAINNEDAFVLAELLCDGKPFELWHGLRFVSWKADN